MKNRIGLPLLGTSLVAAVFLVSLTGPASAESRTRATLRVVGPHNNVMVDRAFHAGTTDVRTSRRSKCLGSGSVNGKTTVPGATALGLLARGAKRAKSLRPLLVSSDLGFGPGLCGIGGFKPPSTGYWALKVDHVFSQVGGADATLEDGDVALWFMVRDYNNPNPDELYLKLRSRVKRKHRIKARVFSYDDAGKRSVVRGAKLRGARAKRTNRRGVTWLRLKRSTAITARKAGSIVSNRVRVTVRNRR